jgi:cytochrome c1
MTTESKHSSTKAQPSDPTYLMVEPDANRRARLTAEAHEAALAHPLDVAKDGGRYMVNDVLVDAEGNPVERDE